MRARLPRLHPAWRSVVFALRPSRAEVQEMLRQLTGFFGERDAACLLGVPAQSFRHWAAGLSYPTAGAVRAVWLVWALTLHPERCRSLLDLATWGRFRVERRERADGVWDWSI